MTPLTAALRDIFLEIPPEILQRVFGPGHSIHLTNRPAVEAAIREKVIDVKVRVDCDLAGGAEATIPLYNLPWTLISPYAASVRIPKERTNGRTITSVLAITYGNAGVQGYQAATDLLSQFGDSGFGAYNSEMLGIMNAQTAIPDMQNVFAYLVGDNTVAVEGYSPTVNYGHLRCILTHDHAMATLKPQAATWFSELCVLAVKAYIYNYYIIKMDTGELSGGRELQAFRMIIEGYADAAELYKEFYRTTWRKVNYMNDATRWHRLIKGMTGALK